MRVNLEQIGQTWGKACHGSKLSWWQCLPNTALVHPVALIPVWWMNPGSLAHWYRLIALRKVVLWGLHQILASLAGHPSQITQNPWRWTNKGPRSKALRWWSWFPTYYSACISYIHSWRYIINCLPSPLYATWHPSPVLTITVICANTGVNVLTTMMMNNGRHIFIIIETSSVGYTQTFTRNCREKHEWPNYDVIVAHYISFWNSFWI